MSDSQASSTSTNKNGRRRIGGRAPHADSVASPLQATSIDCAAPADNTPGADTQAAAGDQALPSPSIRLKSGLRYDQLLQYVERNPSLSILEIGVARAANTLRMMAYADRLGGTPKYVGIDLFGSLTPEQFEESFCHENKRPQTREQTMDMLRKMLGPQIALRIMLLEGLSNDVLPQLRRQDLCFDLIFIDGGHSYEMVRSDWNWCQNLLAPGGTIVLDDYPNWGIGPTVHEIDSTRWNVRILPHTDVFQNHRTDENPEAFRRHQLVEVTRREG